MTKPVLMIDGQLFQSNTWHRGMGKYSLDLLDALSKASFFERYAGVYIILNTELEQSNERIKALKTIYPFLITSLTLRTIDKRSDLKKARNSNRAMLDAFVDRLSEPEVDFLLLSLFEDIAFPTFPERASRKILLFYDIIPFLFSGEYLGDELSQRRYFSHFPEVFEADQIMTISETTR